MKQGIAKVFALFTPFFPFDAETPATERQMGDHQMQPPSFAQSEFEMITRRQKNSAHGLKIIDIPSRFPNLDNDWEFVVRIIYFSLQ